MASFGAFWMASCFKGYLHMARGGFKVENSFVETHWIPCSAAAP